MEKRKRKKSKFEMKKIMAAISISNPKQKDLMASVVDIVVEDERRMV